MGSGPLLENREKWRTPFFMINVFATILTVSVARPPEVCSLFHSCAKARKNGALGNLVRGFGAFSHKIRPAPFRGIEYRAEFWRPTDIREQGIVL